MIAEEHDIFGDGVTVATRQEALAEPGGICVSRVVRDQVQDRLDFAFEDNVKQIGHELGVRYVLEGGLRNAGGPHPSYRQLVEAGTGNHVWAERYDRDLADIVAVQDEITPGF